MLQRSQGENNPSPVHCSVGPLRRQRFEPGERSLRPRQDTDGMRLEIAAPDAAGIKGTGSGDCRVYGRDGAISVDQHS
jgi:hypothetical protein